MMSKKAKHLTNSEEDLMEIFWEKKEPLTSVDISDISADLGHLFFAVSFLPVQGAGKAYLESGCGGSRLGGGCQFFYDAETSGADSR